MNWRSHLLYWIIPTLVLAGLVAMYFSNVNWLMSVLAPQFNRELGLLESLQNVLLVAIIGIVGWRMLNSSFPMERKFFALILAGSVFMLLEELDYGTHYWWLLSGGDISQQPKFSLHNIDNDRYLDVFKIGGDIVMALWFVIFAWAGARSRNVWIGLLRPSRMFTLALLAAILVSDTAHYLEETVPPKPNYLTTSIGEFRELFTYYIWLLYLGTLALHRAWPQSQQARS